MEAGPDIDHFGAQWRTLRALHMKTLKLVTTFSMMAVTEMALARPYAALSGLGAAADSAATAGTNPAGIMRFTESSQRVELLAFFSESEWEGQLGETQLDWESDDSSEIVVPSGYMIKPINENMNFSFTILGVGFSDDLGDWPGRYFIETYDSVNISAFPSLAYRVNEKLSIAGSLSLTYSIFEQERAVANFLDPGFKDGKAELDTDGFDVGFGLSMLYEINDTTRWGLNYLSEIEPSLDGDSDYSGLGPNTQAALEKAGILGADVEVNSRTPQSLIFGLYHEFDNDHAFTVDLAWSDFSRFRLSEFYFNGETMAETEEEYQDIWATSIGYSWPIAERWMLGVAGVYASSGVEDDKRTMTFRLDDIWGVGVEAEWQWTERRNLLLGMSYMTLGDAPVNSPEIPIIGSASGKYTSRDIIMLRLGLTFGAL